MTPYFCLALAGLLTIAAVARATDVMTLAKANQQALDRIRSVAVDVNVAKTVVKNGKMSEKDYNFTWFLQGQEQRVRSVKRIKSDKPQFFDAYNGTHGFKSLDGYDFNTNPPVSESGDCAKGFLGTAVSNRFALGLNPKAPLLLEICYFDQAWSVTELVTCAKKAVLVEGANQLAEHRPVVKFTLPEIEYRVSLDPTVNFLIRRLDFETAGKDEEPKARGQVEVLDFQDCGDQVFFPTLVNSRIEYLDDKGGTTVVETGTTRCQVQSVNKPLAPELFEVKFPKGLHCYDETAQAFLIWGDGKPRLTFTSENYYRDWVKTNQPAADTLANSRTLAQWVTITICLRLLIAAFFVLRRRMVRR